jgi:hypothetical protein
MGARLPADLVDRLAAGLIAWLVLNWAIRAEARPGVFLCVEMNLRQPDDWPYPGAAETGTNGDPGRALVAGQRCSCPGTQALHPDLAIWGHFTSPAGSRGVGPVTFVPDLAAQRP